MKKITKSEATEELPTPTGTNLAPILKTEKEKLLELYQTLKDLGINSIGDLENKIARL